MQIYVLLSFPCDSGLLWCVPGAALHRGPAAGGECKFTYYSVFRVIVACFGVSLVLHCIVDQRQEVSPLDAIRA